MHAVAQTDSPQGGLGALDTLSGVRAVINQWQFDVMQSRSASQQIEGLKNEANLPVANPGQFVIIQVANQVPVEPIFAFTGSIEAADQIHQRRFARS